MSKFRAKIEELKAIRDEALSKRWEEINAKVSKWKEEITELNNELRQTSYNPRRAELVARRKVILEEARTFYLNEDREQTELYSSYKGLFNGLIKVDEVTLSGVDLVNLDASKYNISFLKDVIISSSREQIEEAFENACYEGDAVMARLIQMYASMKFSEVASESKEGLSREQAIEKQTTEQANKQATEIVRLVKICRAASQKSRGITTGKWRGYDTINEFVNSIWNESDPWANQGLSE